MFDEHWSSYALMVCFLIAFQFGVTWFECLFCWLSHLFLSFHLMPSNWFQQCASTSLCLDNQIRVRELLLNLTPTNRLHKNQMKTGCTVDITGFNEIISRWMWHLKAIQSILADRTLVSLYWSIFLHYLQHFFGSWNTFDRKKSQNLFQPTVLHHSLSVCGNC